MDLDLPALIEVTIPDIAGSSVGEIIGILMPYIFGLAGFVLLAYLVLGGYDVLISQGDPKKMAQGRMRITYAIVGFIVVFVGYWLVQLVGRILDITQLRDIFG